MVYGQLLRYTTSIGTRFFYLIFIQIVGYTEKFRGTVTGRRKVDDDLNNVAA
jgi:hypothetical protein